jgi:hypothetical protein
MKWKFNLMVKFDWEKVDMVQCFLERFKEIMWLSLYISDIPSTAGSIILRDRQGKLGSGDRSLLAGKTVTTVQYYGKIPSSGITLHSKIKFVCGFFHPNSRNS